MALLYVTVTGNLGPAAAGAYVAWTPTGWLTDATDLRVIPPAPLPPARIAADGTFTSGPLLAQDSPGPQPAGEAWQLIIDGISGVAPWTQTYQILHASGATQDLSTLTTAVANPVYGTYLTLLYPAGAAAGYVWTSDSAGYGSWEPPPTGAGFTQAFSGVSTVTVTHNLGRFPAVTVIDTADDVCFGDVRYLSTAALTVTFSASFSGTVICT